KTSIALLVDEERVVGAGGRRDEERARAAVGSRERDVGSMREVSRNLRLLTLGAENGGQGLFELGGTGSFGQIIDLCDGATSRRKDHRQRNCQQIRRGES